VETTLGLYTRIADTFSIDLSGGNPYYSGRSFRTKAFVDMFFERVTPLLVGTDGNLWYYNPSIGQPIPARGGSTEVDMEGPYCPDGDDLLSRAYNLISGDQYNESHLRTVQSYIRTSVDGNRGRFDPTIQDPDFLPFLNGILEIRTLKLHPHDPKFLHPNVIPHNWNPDAKCKTLENALDAIFAGDQQLIDLYFHIAGNVLYRGKPLQSISWWFYGNGRNGKSILGEYLRFMVGDHNTCNLPPQKLDERFMSSRLEGKSLNLCTDAPMQTFGDTSVFKQAISGEVLEVERKNEHLHPITPFATHVVGTNQRPSSPRDVSLGFRRRTCVIPFEVMFVPSPGTHQRLEDVAMATRIQAEVEGALVRAISSLRSLLLQMDNNNGRIEWNEPEACKREMGLVIRSSNPTIAYFTENFGEDDCFGPVKDAEYRALTAVDLYEHYKKWFVESGCRGKPTPKGDFLDEIQSTAGERSQRVLLEKDPVLNKMIVAGLKSDKISKQIQNAVEEYADKMGIPVEDAQTILAEAAHSVQVLEAAADDDEAVKVRVAEFDAGLCDEPVNVGEPHEYAGGEDA
jgi:P4 family phage/plasmid primase-like protien